MKLKAFTPEDLATKASPYLTVSKANYFRFNSGLKEQLGLDHGDKVVLSQDEENPKDWYIVINAPKGFELRQKDEEDKGLLLQSSPLVKVFRESLNLPPESKSIRFRVAQKPAGEDMPGVYAILTSNPL